MNDMALGAAMGFDCTAAVGHKESKNFVGQKWHIVHNEPSAAQRKTVVLNRILVEKKKFLLF